MKKGRTDNAGGPYGLARKHLSLLNFFEHFSCCYGRASKQVTLIVFPESVTAVYFAFTLRTKCRLLLSKNTLGKVWATKFLLQNRFNQRQYYFFLFHEISFFYLWTPVNICEAKNFLQAKSYQHAISTRRNVNHKSARTLRYSRFRSYYFKPSNGYLGFFFYYKFHWNSSFFRNR